MVIVQAWFNVAKNAGKLCFVEGTLVHTQDGLKPIEEIQVGDLVESKDEFTGETTQKPVVELFRNYDKAILNITLVGSDGEEELLGATKEYPFWVEGRVTPVLVPVGNNGMAVYQVGKNGTAEFKTTLIAN